VKQGQQKKSCRVDVSKLRRAQKCLGTRTEAETIDKALDLAADEAELAKALKRLVDKGRGHFADAASEEP
jgi:hypothetical protein